MRKIVVKTFEDRPAVVQDLEIEPERHGLDYRTVAVCQERPATSKEILLWNLGYGRMIKF